ncbi:uncharacterized protein Z518_01856 [Rhinocladiella mackenziei CBS 650.93]|uniref:Signal recognition particle subunit SRP14 n=1 Tax=Rhinocladiella mackenziei CBS 650.93 TaxID=1442369 RepID=A0A0D2H9N9_9EURO|nr:uncharacterized protein Z518_01856 [Rhinocladiella mackenziei CBS 650.93]KIX07203.1 hypothetical protein Z518_01856 [Rhinocladiella mackenziei CBS 650.93]
MAQIRMSNDEVRKAIHTTKYAIAKQKTDFQTKFLSQLTTLLSSTHSAAHGSVYLTQKSLSDSTTESSSSPPRILIRATNGLSKPYRTAKPKTKESVKPKVKLATVVEAADLDTFYARYAEVCKKGMEGLRKRDKKKAKEKAKAKKRGNRR